MLKSIPSSYIDIKSSRGTGRLRSTNGSEWRGAEIDAPLSKLHIKTLRGIERSIETWPGSGTHQEERAGITQTKVVQVFDAATAVVDRTCRRKGKSHGPDPL
jgi:hypothetical protein